MSDYIPFEVQVEIIKRLPVKSLVQFRSVSRRWKALIDSSEFITNYRAGHTQPQRLLVWYQDAYIDPWVTGKKIVSFLDDETLKSISFPQEIDPTALGLAKPYKDFRVVGSSQGLWCLYESHRDRSSYNSGTAMAVLWNPSIRKSVGVVVPRVLGWGFQQTVLGFGVCPISNDPTIVKITNVSTEMKNTASVPWVVEVFTLSTGSWKLLTSKLPDKLVTVTWDRVVVDEFICWFAFHGIDTIGEYGASAKKLITLFNMTTQQIKLLDLPNSFAHGSSMDFSISKVRDSLAVLEYITNAEKRVCNVWMMNHDVPNLFTKLFTINTPYTSISVLGFTKSGSPLLQTQDEYGEPAVLVSYEPFTERLKYSGIDANYGSYFVDSYMETLHLLDQPESSVFSVIN